MCDLTNAPGSAELTKLCAGSGERPLVITAISQPIVSFGVEVRATASQRRQAVPPNFVGVTDIASFIFFPVFCF